MLQDVFFLLSSKDYLVKNNLNLLEFHVCLLTPIEVLSFKEIFSPFIKSFRFPKLSFKGTKLSFKKPSFVKPGLAIPKIKFEENPEEQKQRREMRNRQ